LWWRRRWQWRFPVGIAFWGYDIAFWFYGIAFCIAFDIALIRDTV
jgi:hypothetical protein